MGIRTVVLATPPWSYGLLADGLRTPWSRDLSPQGILPSMALHHLATSLEFAGHRVRVIEGYESSEADLVDRILADRPDVVALSVVTPLWGSARALLSRLRASRPGLRLAVGGPHAQIRGSALLDECEALDKIFVGFSEGAFVAWVADPDPVRALMAGAHLPPVHPPGWGRRLVSRIPWHQLIPNVVFLRDLPHAITFTTWGCPRPCASCHAAAFAGPGLHRDVGVIIEEVRRMAELGIRHLQVLDDVPLFSRPSTEAVRLVEAFGQLGMPWSAYMDHWDVEEDWFREWRKAGCWRVLFPIESGMDGIRTFAKGHAVSEASIRATLERARRAGLEVAARFQIGYPGETVDDARATVRFAESLPLHLASFFRHTGYPESATARFHAQRGVHPPEGKWSFYGRPTPPDAMTESEQAAIIGQAIRRFYADPRRWSALVGSGTPTVRARRTLHLLRRFAIDGPR